MEMWFSDIHTDGVKLSIRIEEQLFSAQSDIQFGYTYGRREAVHPH